MLPNASMMGRTLAIHILYKALYCALSVKYNLFYIHTYIMAGFLLYKTAVLLISTGCVVPTFT